MVANGKRGKAGNVSLDNVRYIYNPGSLQVAVFPALATGREWTRPWPGKDEVQLSSASATVRPNADGSGWLIDAWAGIQLKKIGWNESKGERGVDESEYRDVDKIRAISPATFVEKTWEDVLVTTE